MDYAKIAREVIENVGGKSNIKSVQHCATRLRLQLKDNDLRNEDVISDIEGVKGVFLTQSQFQIIFGSGLVNLVCDEVQKQLGNVVDTADDEPEEKKGNLLQRLVKMLSDIFVPIIPAIVAGGLLMGINNILTSGLIDGKSIIDLYPQWKGLATAINMFASAPFTFLPVLIGFSAAKKFGGNPFLGAAMGMIMVHPDLLSAYSIGVAEAPVWNIFGFEIEAIGYQGTVLPVLAVAFILATIEKKLHKVTPTWLDNLTTPLLSIMITSFLTFICVGPVLREAGNLLAAGIPGFISMKPTAYVNFFIGIILSMAVSAVLTMIFWKKFHMGEEEQKEKVKEISKEETVVSDEESVLYSPMKGEVLPINKSNDPAFASGAMGDGVCINPAEGVVYAPTDGIVSLVFPTKHAIGIALNEGGEFLIHAGIDTVKMEGEGFELFAEAGDRVKKGDKLLSFDMDLVKEKGYQTQTMFLAADTKGKELTVMPSAKADNDTKIMILK